MWNLILEEDDGIKPRVKRSETLGTEENDSKPMKWVTEAGNNLISLGQLLVNKGFDTSQTTKDSRPMSRASSSCILHLASCIGPDVLLNPDYPLEA